MSISFQKRLSLIMKGDLDKTLFVLLDKTCEDYIDEESFRKLLDILDNKSTKYTRIEGLEGLLKASKEQNKWQGALKVLMVYHKLIHSIGGEFLQYYSPDKIANIAKFEVDKSSLKGLVHSAIVPNYYTYLQKLSYNYDDLKACFAPKYDFTERLNENKLSLLHFLSKVQNILLYLFKLFPLFEAAFEKFQGTSQIKQLAYFSLTDAKYFYTYVNELITSMLREIFHLVEDDAIFLYELYSEHVKITKQLSKFFELKNYLKEFSFKLPEFFSMDVKFNREVELYILSLKKNLSNNHGVNTCHTDIGSIELPPGCAYDDKRSSRRPLTPFNDVLKSLQSTSATMPNLKPSSKQLFKPPVIPKNNKPHTQIPQAKFYRAETEREEEKGSYNEFDRSKQNFIKCHTVVHKGNYTKTSPDNVKSDPGETSLLSISSNNSDR